MARAGILDDKDILGLNCSADRLLVRIRYRGADAAPMDVSAFEMTYNETCQVETPILSHVGTIINLKMAPAIMVLTLCTNILICIVLTRKNMISSTNVILLGMAIADMLTGVCPQPVFIASYFMGVPKRPGMAHVLEFFVQYMPTCWHAASVWLTVLLAVQRFVFITFPTHVKTLCTVRHSVIVSIVIFIFSFVFNGVLLSIDFMAISVGCQGPQRVQWGEPRLYRCYWQLVRKALRVYMLGRVVLMYILPCVTLTIFTTLLIIGMHTAVRNRRRLLNSSSYARGERDGHSKEANATSRMLIVVLIIFLVVEVPNGIALTLYYAIPLLVPPELIEALNFAIVVSYPVNFFVYCAMSRQFRGTFRNLLGISDASRGRAPVTEVTQQRKRSSAEQSRALPRPNCTSTATTDVSAANGQMQEEPRPPALPLSQTLPRETYEEDEDEGKGLRVMETAVDLDTDLHAALMAHRVA